MEKSAPAASPDAYVDGLTGWQKNRVAELRAAVRAAGEMDEVIKWGHLVYLSNGPVCLIRAEGKRLLFGLWRGQRLLDHEPKLKAGVSPTVLQFGARDAAGVFARRTLPAGAKTAKYA